MCLNKKHCLQKILCTCKLKKCMLLISQIVHKYKITTHLTVNCTTNDSGKYLIRLGWVRSRKQNTPFRSEYITPEYMNALTFRQYFLILNLTPRQLFLPATNHQEVLHKKIQDRDQLRCQQTMKTSMLFIP